MRAAVAVALGAGTLIGTMSVAQGTQLEFLRVWPDVIAGANPRAVATGNFMDDPELDVVVANYDSSDVSLFYGSGYGTFVDAGAPYATGSHPTAVAVGDFNGDDRPDIVTANDVFPEDEDGVSVLLNQGAKGFGAAIGSATGATPQAVVVGKFNDDEFDDVATADNLDDTVSILISKGDGTFKAPVPLRVGAGPLGLVAADLNDDRIVDLAVVSNADVPASATVLPGDGKGGFTTKLPPITFDPLVVPTSIAADDVTGDGATDLVVADEDGDSVLVLRGKGNFTFEAAGTFTVGVLPSGLAIDDFDGDGVKDIVTCSPFGSTLGSTVDVLRGKGSGTFDEVKSFAVGTGAVAVVAADVNGDHRPDLLTANPEGGTGEGTLSVLLDATGGLPVCTGDCRIGGSVTGEDLAAMVGIALGGGTLAPCGAGDPNFDGQVTVEELVQAAANALSSDCVLSPE